MPVTMLGRTAAGAPVDARQRPERHDHDMAVQLDSAEWLRVEPPSCAAERGECARTSCSAKRPEPGTNLVTEDLGLLPGGKVPALGDFVVVDEVGVRLLCPTLRDLIELVGKNAHRNRDGDTLGVKEAEHVLSIETSR